MAARPQKSAARGGAGSRPPLRPGPDGVVRLAGGNPQIPKGEGDAPVQAFIRAMPGWQREIGHRLDAIITQTVPDVCKSVRWNSPFYGTDPASWFVSFHCMSKYIKVAFPAGTALDPVPPGTSKQAGVRYLDIYADPAFDAARFAAWIGQASRLPGSTF